MYLTAKTFPLPNSPPSSFIPASPSAKHYAESVVATDTLPVRSPAKGFPRRLNDDLPLTSHKPNTSTATTNIAFTHQVVTRTVCPSETLDIYRPQSSVYEDIDAHIPGDSVVEDDEYQHSRTDMDEYDILNGFTPPEPPSNDR